MKTYRLPVPACLLLFLITVSSVAAQDQFELNDATYPKVRDHVVPNHREISYLDIHWRPNLWRSFKEANEKKKPVLLWAMNGHPLGHT